MNKKISFSKAQCFLTCQKKYYWQYVKKLFPANTAPAYLWGIEFHKGAQGLPTETITLPYAIGLLAREYYGDAKKNVEVEKRFLYNIGDVEIDYRADLIIDGTELVEYKTTSRPTSDNVMAQMMSNQHSIGAYVSKCSKVTLRMVKKPTIRHKQSESEQEFFNRALDIYRNEPRNNFLAVELPIVRPEEALGEIMTINTSIGLADACKTYVKNAPYACFGLTKCPYLELCSDYSTYRQLYIEKEIVHALPEATDD